MDSAPIFDGYTNFGLSDPNFNCPRKNNFGTLGLPDGVEQTQTLNNRTDPYLRGGAALPRPFGPRDNIRMTMLEQINGFGRKKGKGKGHKKKSSSKLIRKLSKKIELHKKKIREYEQQLQKISRSNSFGFPNFDGMQYVSPTLTSAKGYMQPSNLNTNDNYNTEFNVPMEYDNNVVNRTNYLGYGKSRRRKNKFGLMEKIDSPNVVAYENPIPLFHGGGLTKNWQTGESYPNGELVGDASNLLKVLPDGITPNAMLNVTDNIQQVANNGTVNSLTAAGLRGNSFGNYYYDVPNYYNSGNGDASGSAIKNELIFEQERIGGGSGITTTYSPPPPYLNRDQGVVSGNYVTTGFGRNKKKVPISQKKPQKIQKPSQKPNLVQKKSEIKKIPAKLSTNYEGSTITLTKKGKIIVA